MPLKRCVFPAVAGLADSVTTTQHQVQGQMDAWAKAHGLASADWLDEAGGVFEPLGRAWIQVCDSFKEMGIQAGLATTQANEENAQVVNACAGRFGGTGASGGNPGARA